MTGAIWPSSLKRDFRRDGFAAVRSFLELEETVELRERVARFIDHIVPSLPPERVFYESKQNALTLKQIQHMEADDEWFAHLFHEGRLRELAEHLLDGPVLPKNLQYFNKPPQTGLPTPAHQDGFYFMIEPCEAVTLWLALDTVDEENGCVRYLPGSHVSGLRPHEQTQTLGFSQGIVDYPTKSDVAHEVAIPAQPGDLLVHHALTIHRADGNRSANRTRRALGFIYFSHRAQEDTSAQEAYQRRLAERWRAAGKI